MLFFALTLLDLLTTYMGGMQYEANPIGRALIVWNGFEGLIIAKIVAVAIYALVITWLKKKSFLAAFIFRWTVVLVYLYYMAQNAEFVMSKL